MSKKIFVMLFLIMTFACGCAKKNEGPDLYDSIRKRDELVVGMTFDSKPFSYIDSDGRAKGVEVDLVREIANRMLGSKDKVVFKKLIPQERIKAANYDDIDIVISAITINRARKKIVEFSEPYFIAGQVVCVKKDSDIKSIKDLINKKVVVLLGTTGEESIERFAPNALIWGFVDTEEAIDEFKSSPVDAIITDDSLLRGLAMENGEYMLLPKRLTEEPYGIAFEKSSQSKKFKKELNKIIKEMKDDGTIFTIEEEWNLH